MKNHLKPRFFILKFENKQGTEREQTGNKEGIEREQTGNLNKQINYKTDKQYKEEGFEDFWNHYHDKTGKNKTDKEPALKK